MNHHSSSSDANDVSACASTSGVSRAEGERDSSSSNDNDIMEKKQHDKEETTTTTSSSMTTNAIAPLQLDCQQQQQQPGQGPPQEQKEPNRILMETLDELEKERANRLELEAKIAALKEQKQQQHPEKHHKKKRKSSISIKQTTDTADPMLLGIDNGNDNISRTQFAALQAQVKGYRQLVDAMTAGRPAMVSAAKNSTEPNALPLHVIRFLELMPWHPTAQRAAIVTEEIYEWQVYRPHYYDNKTHSSSCWTSELAYFPTFFQALPLVCPAWNGRQRDTSNNEETLSLPHTTDDIGVWTNQGLTHRYELRDGYLLPHSPKTPTWKWVGGWFVHVPVSLPSLDYNNDMDNADALCDAQGWSYAQDASHFLQASSTLLHNNNTTFPNPHVFSNNSHTTNKTITPMVRRRRWYRKRVLVDYPHASEFTVHYLNLMVAGEEMKLAASKLYHQWKEKEHASHQMQALYTNDRNDWKTERQQLQEQLQLLQDQLKQRRELLERQKGPPLSPFIFFPPFTTTTTTMIKKASDDDNGDGETLCQSSCDDESEQHDDDEFSSSSSFNEQSDPLLLHPEVGITAVNHRTDPNNNNHCQSSTVPGSPSSLFSWIHNNHSHNPPSNNSSSSNNKLNIGGKATTAPAAAAAAQEEFAPEVGSCSDDNSSHFSSPVAEDRDDSECNADDEITQCSALKQLQEHPHQHQQSGKSFLQVFFFNKP